MFDTSLNSTPSGSAYTAQKNCFSIYFFISLTFQPHPCFVCPSSFQYSGGSVDIDLEVFVNRSTAPELNCGKEQIEDILVLHLERGKDYFISVSGNYLPSCYGTSIRSLCHMREPIQDMPPETLHELVTVPVCRQMILSLKCLVSTWKIWCKI